MPKKIFFDVNVIIDLLHADNNLNVPTKYLFSRLKKNKDIFYCSPTTFAITYYFLNKIIRNNQLLNKEVISFFSEFNFTKEDNVIMEKVKTSGFKDLEDALQYYSALDSRVSLIITNNYFDFTPSKIPVYHPLQYINQFLI
jgi:predicted nucleic acid-binding protein